MNEATKDDCGACNDFAPQMCPHHGTEAVRVWRLTHSWRCICGRVNEPTDYRNGQRSCWYCGGMFTTDYMED